MDQRLAEYKTKSAASTPVKTESSGSIADFSPMQHLSALWGRNTVETPSKTLERRHTVSTDEVSTVRNRSRSSSSPLGDALAGYAMPPPPLTQEQEDELEAMF